MKIAEDLLLILGVLLIIGTTFYLNIFIGLYTTGIFCIAVSILLAKTRVDKPPE